MHRLVCTSLDWTFTEVTQHHKNQIREKQLSGDEKGSESQLPQKQGRQKAAFTEAPGDLGDTPLPAVWFSVWTCGSISHQFSLKARVQNKTPKEELKDERWRLRGKNCR